MSNWRIRGWLEAAAVAVALGLTPAAASADDDEDEDADIFGFLESKRPACTGTAMAVFLSCKSEVEADLGIAAGECMNLADPVGREECFAEARASRDEARLLCREQLAARREVCTALGEERYDPVTDPADFDDDLAHPTHPNPYFPLTIGNIWEFGGAESVTIEVVDETKWIEGIRCIVVRDRVFVDGELVEDTDDWFAQAKSGDVHYFGEEVKDYETIEGDDPRRPELVAIAGSFKAGREGDKPGLAFLAAPVAGKVYRQEFSLANAEDVARVLSTTYEFGGAPELDLLVPEELARLLCDGDCVVIEEFTPLHPGPDGIGRKYYAPGIGFFLEVAPESQEVVQLTACNFDPRCEELPEPE